MKQSRVIFYRFIVIFLVVSLTTVTSRAQPSPDAGSHPKRLALVIGNSVYPFLKLPEAAQNSNAIAEALITRDFEVMTLTNATEKQMAASLREFAQRLGSQGGDGLFYFAGHAVQVADINYLLPVDINVQQEYEVKYSAISLTQVFDVMRFAENRNNVIILDSAYKGLIGPAIYPARSGLAAVTTAELPANTLLATATQPDITIFDPGLYSRELVMGLQNPELTLMQILRNLDNTVSAATSDGQKPWMISNLTAAPELKPFKSEQPGVQAVPAVTKTDSVDKTAFSSSATAPSDLEKLFWESVESNRSIQGYQLYLERFPNGYYSSLAQQRIQGINSPAPVNEPPGNDTNTASVADQEQEPITDETSSETDMAGSDTPVTTEAAQPSEKIAGSATAEPVLATVAANQPDRLTDKLTDPDTKQLIEQAWQAFDKKALTTPAGDNAVKWAKMALEKSTQDTAAREVLNAVVDTYISWSRSNLNRGQLARASSYLSKARSLDSYASGPQQTQMTELAGSIRKRQQEVAVTRTRDTRNDSQVPGTLNKLESWLNTDADADFQSHRSR